MLTGVSSTVLVNGLFGAPFLTLLTKSVLTESPSFSRKPVRYSDRNLSKEYGLCHSEIGFD